jgi:hypothetical protein
MRRDNDNRIGTGTARIGTGTARILQGLVIAGLLGAMIAAALAGCQTVAGAAGGLSRDLADLSAGLEAMTEKGGPR